MDRDRVTNFDAIIERAKAKDVKTGWSNPCIEIWFMAYYGSMPTYTESQNCWKDFKALLKRKTGIEYDKADKTIYKRLIESGSEKRACEIAEARYRKCLHDGKTKPSEMLSTTTLYNLICEIKEKVEKEKRGE